MSIHGLIFQFLLSAPNLACEAPQDILHYDIFLDVNIEDQWLDCMAEVTFRVIEPDSALDLHLMGFQVGCVAGLTEELPYKRLGDTLTILLPHGMERGDTCSVAIAYSGHPLAYDGPEYLNAGVIFEDDLMYSLGMEPGCGGYVYPCVEDISDKASYSFHITVEEGLWGIANGSLTGIEESCGKLTYSWNHPEEISVYLVAMVAGDFQVLQDPDEEWICHWIDPDMDQEGRDVLGRTGSIVEFFQSVFCPYPWSGGLGTIVVGPGGNEHNTKIFISQASFDYSSDWAMEVLVHEIAHHWWGNYVTEADWTEMWLAEAFATYSEIIWLEHEAGPDSASSSHRRTLLSYYWSAETDPIVPAKGINLWSNTVYNKGAFVVGMLRRTLGDEAFFRTLQLFLSSNAFGSATTEDLRRIAENVSGMKLGWFFRQWVYGHGCPWLDLEYTISPIPTGGSELALQLYQTQPDHWPVFRLDIDLFASDSSSDTTFSVQSRDRLFSDTLHLTFQPDTLILDPEQNLIHLDSATANRSRFNYSINYAGWMSTEPIYVLPTAEADTTVQARIWGYVESIRDRFSPEGQLLTDRDVLSMDISRKTLYVYGSPQGNLWLRKYLSLTPFNVKEGSITAGDTFFGEDLRLIASILHPDNPMENVVIYTAWDPEEVVGINSIFHGPTPFAVGVENLVLATGWYTDPDSAISGILLDSIPSAPPKRTVRIR